MLLNTHCVVWTLGVLCGYSPCWVDTEYIVWIFTVLCGHSVCCVDTHRVVYSEVLEAVKEEEEGGVDVVEAGREGATLGLTAHLILQRQLNAGGPAATSDNTIVHKLSQQGNMIRSDICSISTTNVYRLMQH